MKLKEEISEDLFNYLKDKIVKSDNDMEVGQNWVIMEIFSTYFQTKDKDDLIESLQIIYDEDYQYWLSTRDIELSSENSY